MLGRDDSCQILDLNECLRRDYKQEGLNYLQHINLCDIRDRSLKFVPSYCYLDNVWDGLSIWFYLLVVLEFMYAYSIFKRPVYELPSDYLSF